MPYGSLAKIPTHTTLEMDVDMEKEISKVPLHPGKKKEKEADAADVGVKKGKKRKVDVVIDLPAAKKPRVGS